MKRLALALALLLTTSAFAGEAIKRGDAVPDGKATPLADVLKNPEAYKETPVLVEGVVSKVCSEKGCWMELAPEAGKSGMRVTMKDYGFFVPTDSKGLKARALGTTTVTTLDKKKADHLAKEGATLNRAADGTAREVAFVANGVELRK
jgi:hypothetical protein